MSAMGDLLGVGHRNICMGFYRHETRSQHNRNFRVYYFRRAPSFLDDETTLVDRSRSLVRELGDQCPSSKYLPLIFYWGYAIMLLEHGCTLWL